MFSFASPTLEGYIVEAMIIKSGDSTTIYDKITAENVLEHQEVNGQAENTDPIRGDQKSNGTGQARGDKSVTSAKMPDATSLRSLRLQQYFALVCFVFSLHSPFSLSIDRSGMSGSACVSSLFANKEVIHLSFIG